jgi:predicted hydrocarbon binding protein
MPKLVTGNEVFDHIADIDAGASILVLDITRFESMHFLNSLLQNSPYKDKVVVVSCEPIDTPFQLRKISLDRFQDPTELSIEMERYRQAVGDHGVVIHHYLPHVLVKESEDLVLRMIEYWLMKQPSVTTSQFFTLPKATFTFFEKKLQSLVSGVISISVLKTEKERCLSFQIVGSCRPEYHMEEFPFVVENGCLLIKWREAFTDMLPREEEAAITNRIDYLKTNFNSTKIIRDDSSITTESLSPYDKWLLLQLIGWRLEEVERYFPESLNDILRKLALWNLKGLVKFEEAEFRTPSSPKGGLKTTTRLALLLPTVISLQALRKRRHTIPMSVYNALRRSVQAFASDRLREDDLKKELTEFETYFQDVTARTAAVETFAELGEDLRSNMDLKYLPKILSLAIYYGYGLKASISKMSEELYKIELRDCFICSDVKSESPVCQLLIGTIVGCCSVVFKEHFSCNEAQCKASGEKSCVFYLRRR